LHSHLFSPLTVYFTLLYCNTHRSTLQAYKRVHSLYRKWCIARNYPPPVDLVTDKKIEAYIKDTYYNREQKSKSGKPGELYSMNTVNGAVSALKSLYKDQVEANLINNINWKNASTRRSTTLTNLVRSQEQLRKKRKQITKESRIPDHRSVDISSLRETYIKYLWVNENIKTRQQLLVHVRNMALGTLGT
jgi:hypothetical protein